VLSGIRELTMIEISEDFFDGHTPKDQVLAVRTEDKFKFTSKIILDFLELRKGKASRIKDIVDATGFDRDTVAKHLLYLVSTRQAYKINDSGEGAYHKNGRIVHYRNMDNRIFNNKLYSFFQLEGLDGDNYVYIQEKEVGKLKSVSVKGGIVVKEKDFRRFIDELRAFSNEIHENKKNADNRRNN
jgi:hypothetical protein